MKGNAHTNTHTHYHHHQQQQPQSKRNPSTNWICHWGKVPYWHASMGSVAASCKVKVWCDHLQWQLFDRKVHSQEREEKHMVKLIVNDKGKSHQMILGRQDPLIVALFQTFALLTLPVKSASLEIVCTTAFLPFILQHFAPWFGESHCPLPLDFIVLRQAVLSPDEMLRNGSANYRKV